MRPEPTHRRGDIWLTDLGAHPTDPEQAFERPVVVVSDDRLHHPRLQMVVIVPGTSRRRDLPLHLTVEPDDENGLGVSTDFQPEQIRAVSKVRLLTRLGRLDPVSRHSLDELIRNVLGLH